MRLTSTRDGATRLLSASGQIGARPFSADGRLLALVDGSAALLYDTAPGPPCRSTPAAGRR